MAFTVLILRLNGDAVLALLTCIVIWRLGAFLLGNISGGGFTGQFLKMVYGELLSTDKEQEFSSIEMGFSSIMAIYDHADETLFND